MNIIIVTAQDRFSSLLEGIERRPEVNFIHHPRGLAIDGAMTELRADIVLVEPTKTVLQHIAAAMGAANNCIQWGPLRIDKHVNSAYYEKQRLPLTQSEFRILWMLAAQGRVISREELEREALGYSASTGSRSLDVHIFSLRKKLDLFGIWIKTERGVGYRLTLTGQAAVLETGSFRQAVL